MRTLGPVVFVLILGFMQTTRAETPSSDSSFINTTSKTLAAKKQLADEETFLFHWTPGLAFVEIEAQWDDRGVHWIRVGIEKQNYVDPESGEDLWFRAEDLATLDVMDDLVLRMTYCYRYVKKYLLRKGFVDVYLPGASAYMAADILPKHGFLKSNRKPAQAKVYDVCVYRGGPSGHGHIEVLDPQGWYYGYGFKTQPIKNRIFSGCFFKK